MTTIPVKHCRLPGARSVLLACLLSAAVVAATPAADGHRHTTTVIRETVYHTPSYRTPYFRDTTVIVPLSGSLYLGLGSLGIDKGYRQSREHRTFTRYDRDYERRHDSYYDRGFRHKGHGNAFGYRGYDRKRHEPARGRWSGADRHRDVIYVDRDGRRSSSYREAERRSVVIRERSR